LSEELESHLRMAVADRVARGESAEEARQAALRELGNVPLIADVTRERWGWLRFERLAQDLRYALRTLGRDRGFTLVAVLILALGIGANIVVFSVVNTILLRPLPFRNAGQLTWFTGSRPDLGLSGVTYDVNIYEEFQRDNHSFQAVTSYNPFFGSSEYKLTGRGEPTSVAGVMVAGNFFQTLGVEPAMGRFFSPEELVKNGRPAVLLSDAYWRTQFHSDPNIVGQSIELNKRAVTIVGVMPAGFDFGAVFAPGTKIDIFTPAVMDDIRGWGNTLAIVGRLKPGVTVDQAQQEANYLFPQMLAAHKDWWDGFSARISGLKEYVTGKLRRSLEMLWCAVGLILLIVCVNIANLLLARATARGKEFALRISLGASRRRLVRQLLTESLVLSASGAAAGLGLAYGVTFWLAHQGSVILPLLSTVRVDSEALGYTVVLAIAAGLVFGLATGLKAAGGNLQQTLKDTGPGAGTGRRHERLRATLVISEVALACILLVSAGLLLRSFLHVLNADLGFEPSHASAIRIDYNDGNKLERRGPLLEEMLRRIAAVPGVESAGISDMLPLDHNRSWQFSAKGHEASKQLTAAFANVASPGYLRTMGIRLLEGRDLSWQDTAKGPRVALINQAAEHRYWPGEDALGKVALIDGAETRVIGIVADVHESSVEATASPSFYVSIAQNDPEGPELLVRSKLPASALATGIVATLRSMNPEQPMAELRPVQTIVDHATSPRRFFAVLVGGFAALGLVLASLGIYGVISYSVTRQTKEIGIRMALGATRERVQMAVIGRTLLMALAGVGIGTVASFAVARAIGSLLFGTSAGDPLTFAGMVVSLLAVALAAGYFPARRAARINPMTALRGN
jgi:predicted permease